jgi:hypothetical protein
MFVLRKRLEMEPPSFPTAIKHSTAFDQLVRWLAWMADRKLRWVAENVGMKKSGLEHYKTTRSHRKLSPMFVDFSIWLSEEWRTPVEPDELAALTMREDERWKKIANRIRRHLSHHSTAPSPGTPTSSSPDADLVFIPGHETAGSSSE